MEMALERSAGVVRCGEAVAPSLPLGSPVNIAWSGVPSLGRLRRRSSEAVWGGTESSEGSRERCCGGEAPLAGLLLSMEFVPTGED